MVERQLPKTLYCRPGTVKTPLEAAKTEASRVWPNHDVAKLDRYR